MFRNVVHWYYQIQETPHIQLVQLAGPNTQRNLPQVWEGLLQNVLETVPHSYSPAEDGPAGLRPENTGNNTSNQQLKTTQSSEMIAAVRYHSAFMLKRKFCLSRIRSAAPRCEPRGQGNVSGYQVR